MRVKGGSALKQLGEGFQRNVPGEERGWSQAIRESFDLEDFLHTTGWNRTELEPTTITCSRPCFKGGLRRGKRGWGW